jgi:hypothetical protein
VQDHATRFGRSVSPCRGRETDLTGEIEGLDLLDLILVLLTDDLADSTILFVECEPYSGMQPPAS